MLVPFHSGIFTANPGGKAIIEVSSAVFELLYYKNYQLRLGFLTYILSDGHFTPGKSPFPPSPVFSLLSVSRNFYFLWSTISHLYSSRVSLEV